MGLHFGWHHVAIGFGAGMKHIFVDGLEHGDGVEGEVATQGGPIIIGGDYDTTGPKGQFSGSIDDVRLYARLLSAAEIDALYRASEL